MNDKIKHEQVDTSANAKIDKKDEPVLPIKIPLSIVRWLAYSAYCSGMLSVWYPSLVGYWGYIGTSLLLGHFASQLNALIKK